MITYREYIPAVVGRPLPRYEPQTYNPSINPAMLVEFSHCAMK
jgi:hypothetical protein